MNDNRRIFLVVCSLCLTTAALGRYAPAVRWRHQIVTPTKDSIFDTLVADSNDGIYLSAERESTDASGSTSTVRYLLKYNQDGDQLWSKQLGANGDEHPLHMAVDGLAADDQENIYVFGHTDSKLGREKKGKYDAFFARYDRAGTQQWVRQVGTAEHDVCAGLDTDAFGNLYVAGYTYGSFAKPHKGGADMFIAAYDKNGKLLWRNQFGTDADERAIDLRLGNDNDVYLCGTTAGSLARRNNGQDDFVVARYERTGKFLWLHQYGIPSQDRGVCMEIGEQGQVYVGGRTLGDLAFRKAQRGYGDAFVVRIDETGKVLWKHQFGSRGWDRSFTWPDFRTDRVTYWQAVVNIRQGPSARLSLVVIRRKVSWNGSRNFAGEALLPAPVASLLLSTAKTTATMRA
jgi:outer membrane protein assembly factor BamB